MGGPTPVKGGITPLMGRAAHVMRLDLGGNNTKLGGTGPCMEGVAAVDGVGTPAKVRATPVFGGTRPAVGATPIMKRVAGVVVEAGGIPVVGGAGGTPVVGGAGPPSPKRKRALQDVNIEQIIK